MSYVFFWKELYQKDLRKGFHIGSKFSYVIVPGKLSHCVKKSFILGSTIYFKKVNGKLIATNGSF